MARGTRSRKKGKKQQPAERKRQERRFLPEQAQASRVSVGVGMVASALLGAGVWAQWISEQQYGFAPYLVAAGALALAAAMWFGDIRAVPVRVGDAGVALEKGPDIIRLAWCDMKRVSVFRQQLFIEGGQHTLSIPIAAHRRAVAWVLAEGTRRVPDAMDVSPTAVDGLPAPSRHDGELRTVTAVQIAGRHCAASDQVISFERDARLCPNCGQVYHKNHVPAECATCEQALGPSAVSP
jgi:hypothetical protein